MPYGQSLPQLDFTNPNPILTPQPVQEFGALVGALNQRYDTGLRLTDDLNTEISRLQTSDLEEDRRRGDMLQQDFLSTVDRIKEAGDYERQVTNLNKLIGDYKREAIPLQQRNAEFQAFKSQLDADKSLSSASKERIIRGTQNQLNQDADFKNTLDLHRFSDLTAGDVNSQEVFQNAAKGVLSRLTDTRGRFKHMETNPITGNVILTFQDETKEEIKRDELEGVLRDELNKNSDLQSFISRERKLRESLGEEGDIDQEVEESLLSVLEGRSGVFKDIRKANPLGGELDAYGRPIGGKKADPFVFNKGDGASFGGNSGVRDIIKSTAELKQRIASGEIKAGNVAGQLALGEQVEKGLSKYVDSQFNMDAAQEEYAKIYMRYAGEINSGERAKPLSWDTLPKTKEEFSNYIKAGDKESLTLLGEIFSEATSGNIDSNLAKVTDDYHKILEEHENKLDGVRVNTNPLTAFDNGKSSNILGEENRLMTEAWTTQGTNYTSLTSGVSLKNSNTYLKDRYGTAEDKIEVAGEEIYGRDPKQDKIVLTTMTSMVDGKMRPVLQLNFTNKDGGAVGVEHVVGSDDDIRKLRRVAEAAYEGGEVELYHELTSNLDVLPVVQSKRLTSTLTEQDYTTVDFGSTQVDLRKSKDGGYLMRTPNGDYPIPDDVKLARILYNDQLQYSNQ